MFACLFLSVPTGLADQMLITCYLTQDPLAIIGLLAIFFPFVVLGVAIGTGYVDLNAGRP